MDIFPETRLKLVLVNLIEKPKTTLNSFLFLKLPIFTKHGNITKKTLD
jgi:hypothetical protein